jgi:CshA-type fibril repeat protein
VSEVLPTAAPTSATGVRGDVLTITPNGSSPAVPLVDASVRVLDPSNGQAVTTLALEGIGTYLVDTGTGEIVFTPDPDFVGANTVLYTVVDSLGRHATSTLTVTLTDYTPSAATVIVTAGETAHVAVAGVPSGSTLAVPGSVTHTDSVSASGSTVTVVPAAGFTGRITFPVTVNHGVAHVDATAVVLVRPTPVPSGIHTVGPAGVTVVTWPASENAAHYQVRVNGVLVCTTTQLTCTLTTVTGPRSRVLVYAVGGDDVGSVATVAAYRRGQLVRLGIVYFATNSAALSGAEQAKLTRIAATLNSFGFTKVTLVGNTDSRGDTRFNLRLSQRRADSTKSFLGHRARGTSFRTVFKGESSPVRDNGSPSGRAGNRRVEIWVN